MSEKNRLFFLLIVICFVIFMGFVSAQTLTSKEDVRYDSEIQSQFILNKWVHVSVDIKDTSNITINYKEDSIEVQTIKDNEKNAILRNITDEVLSTLSYDEFQLKSKSEWGGIFSGNITKEGFNKLLEDERVDHIYAKKYFISHSGAIVKKIAIYFIPIVLFFVLIIFLIKLKKKKWKLKK